MAEEDKRAAKRLAASTKPPATEPSEA